MSHHPELHAFRDHAKQSTLVPVYRQLTADLLTPVSAYSRIAEDGFSFLFESVVGGDQVGRYSFVGSRPFMTVSAFGTEFTIERDGTSETKTVDDPLRELQGILSEYDGAKLPGLPNFCGGAVGYGAYDMVRYTEHLPNVPDDDRGMPDLLFAFHDEMVIFDHIRKVVLVVAHVRVGEADQDSIEAAYTAGCGRVDALCKRLLTAAPQEFQTADIAVSGEAPDDWSSNMTQSEYESAVESAKEYIRAGDIFQVVLSQRLRRETTASPLQIYRALRVVNPSPFMFLMDTPYGQLVGSSPEIMVRVEDGTVTIRPLAGTRKRGATAEEDQRLADELLADPKERAEHVMLVDLGRNDVGRVSDYGSVTLSDVMVVERYSHVMHITSNVQGQLSEKYTSIDALRYGTPAGTVSGAPKVRAMEIIDELEPSKRGPYAGAVGYIDFTGSMDTCIALRTLVIRGTTVDIQAGAGIVADSVPTSEYEETLNKAMGLLKAIDVAERQLT